MNNTIIYVQLFDIETSFALNNDDVRFKESMRKLVYKNDKN